MITHLNVAPVIRIYGNLEKRGVKLSAMRETPLAYMNASIRPGMNVQLESRDPLDFVNEVSGADDEVTGENVHEDILEDVSTTIGNAVYEHFRVLKNDILPLVNQVTEEAKNSLIGYKMNDYEIVSRFIADIHENPVVQDCLERWDDIDIIECPCFSQFPARDEGQILELIATGSEAFDNDLMNMVSGHDGGWLEEVYNNYYRGGYGKTTMYASVDKMDEHLIVHFIARACMDTVPETVDSISGSEYNSIISTMLAQSAAATTYALRVWQRQSASGAVVISYPLTSDVPTYVADNSGEDGKPSTYIEVFGEAYNNYLGAGGKPEHVIGSCVSDRVYRAEELLEKADLFQEAYDRITARMQREFAMRTGSILREAACRAMSRQIADLPAFWTSNGAEVPEMHSTVMHKFSAIGDIELTEDLYRCVRGVACSTLFHKSDSLRILETMDKYMEDRGCDPREAAYYTAIDMILESQLSQVE